MLHTTLPDRDEMLAAFERRDAGYEGVFVTAVRTTGVFCRPTCPARRPRPENVEFFTSAREALTAGYRPCLRCRPLEAAGAVPEWLRPLLAEVEASPDRRFTDSELRDRELDPVRVRRWFQARHGLTFHAYVRARRLGRALGRLRLGEDATRVAYDAGYESSSAFRDAFQRLFGVTPRSGRSLLSVLVTRITTPLGPMVAAASERGLCLLEFADRPMLATQVRRVQARLDCRFAPGDHPVIERTAAQLEEYFAGRRRAFDLPLDLAGTEFQEMVWEALRGVGYGTISTYEELARRIGRPGACRAVGRANGDNRLAVVVPCHRVVGADGQLTGYGGGLWRKRLLLEHEQRNAS